MEEKLNEMDKKKDAYKEEIELLQQNFLKERDEPIRLGKGNENLKKAVEHLKSDLDKLVSDTTTVDTSYTAQ
jgi:prefoldin subunit 5